MRAASSATRAPSRRSPRSRPRRCCGAVTRATPTRRRPALVAAGAPDGRRPGAGRQARRPRRRAGAPRRASTTASRCCAAGRGARGGRGHRATTRRHLPGRLRTRRHRPPPRGRAARLTFGDVESLAFGRLDLADGDRLHVGRVSVIDEDGDVLLVDWRAPAAGAFYRATAGARRWASPGGARWRRADAWSTTSTTSCSTRTRPTALGLTAGHRPGGAARRPVARSAPGTCATSSRRSRPTRTASSARPRPGTLVVAGGPGTGKTVVALHRVAYLLYEDRDRFEGRGVLVVGPSRAVHRAHRARVLPSLGEDRAVQRLARRLSRPRGADVAGWDDPDVAAVKGDLAMVDVCRRLVAAALPPLPPETRVSFEGTTAGSTAARSAKVRRRLLDGVRPTATEPTYHARSGAADEALRAALWRAWRSAHRAAGGPPARGPPRRRASTRRSTTRAQVTMLRRCCWPPLDPVEVLPAGSPRATVDLDRVAADDLLGPTPAAAPRAAWDGAERWTIDDVGPARRGRRACSATPPCARRGAVRRGRRRRPAADR